MKSSFRFVQNVHWLPRNLPASSSHVIKMSSNLATSPQNKEENRTEVKPFSEIPGPKGLYQLPLIGVLLHFKPFTNISKVQIHHFYNKLIDEYGPVCKFQLDQRTVLLSDPDDILTLFRNEGKHPFRPNLPLQGVYNKRTGIVPDMATAQGEDWYRQRTPLNKLLLRPHSITQYLPAQNEVADKFVELLATQFVPTEIEADSLFFKFAAESVGVILFNTRLGFFETAVNQDSKDFITDMMTFFELLQKSSCGEMSAFRLYKDKHYKQYEECVQTLERVTEKLINAAKDDLENRKKNGTFDPEEPNLLLSLLNDDALTNQQVAKLMESLYSGGVDSTGSTLQACFFLLAKYPDKQDKLREEVLEVIGHDGMLTKNALESMPYLRAVLKESYRFYYPVPSGAPRKLPVDVVVGGYHVPAGVQLITYNGKMLVDQFENPDAFIPERWLRDQQTKDNLKNFSWALKPFSHGPRSCIGKRIAEQELYLALAKTVQKLQIGIKPESQNTEFVYKIFLKPEKAIKFTFTRI